MLDMNALGFTENLFWDVDPNTLILEQHKRFITERIMNFGMPDQVIWMLKNIPEESLIKTVRLSRNLNRKTANFWSIHFNIPREEIQCLKNV